MTWVMGYIFMGAERGRGGGRGRGLRCLRARAPSFWGVERGNKIYNLI